MKYAIVENGTVIQELSDRPKGGIGEYGSIGTDMPDAEIIEKFGIYPIYEDAYPTLHKFQTAERVVTVEADRVSITYNIINKTVEEKIRLLAKAKRDYQQEFVEGIASPLVWDGHKLGLTKCTEFTHWVMALNDEYAARKAAINETDDVDLDFSPIGQPPYTIWEAKDEALAALGA